MLICGLKLTHDGAIALIDKGKLVFSVELEKLSNNDRYTSIDDTSVIPAVLNQFGYDINAIDHFVVDGWGGYDSDALAVQPRLTIAENNNKLSVMNNGEHHLIDIAQYEERTIKANLIHPVNFTGLPINGRKFDYSSYLHVTGHVMSAYATSPFAEKGESSFVLVWDGGMYPRLYYVDVESDTPKIENLGPIFLLVGNIYTIFSQHFGPFKVKGPLAKDNLSIAGKVMAYISLGEVRRELFDDFERIYNESYNYPMGFANSFANEFKKTLVGKNVSDEDVLATFHAFLEDLLVSKLIKKVDRFPRATKNLCLAGGCALNIKWNSGIRNTCAFDGVYVPPFPNDSGSAIGAACAAAWNLQKIRKVEWNVYSGPDLIQNEPALGWSKEHCSVADLAKLLHSTCEPVLFLNGRAELGPRALGNRSIIASPSSEKMKGILNLIKDREHYRPVSPICLEEYAESIFTPGTQDLFMLFDHKVKESWVKKIPAVIHLDQTARLQTVNNRSNPEVASLLTEYHKISGIPLLCNTSANFKGKGFFPDIQSATSWGQVNFVWSENTLYKKNEKIKFDF
jgi:carbamoyltransferase